MLRVAEVDIRLTTIKKNKAKRGGAIRSKATAAKKFRIRSSSLEEMKLVFLEAEAQLI